MRPYLSGDMQARFEADGKPFDAEAQASLNSTLIEP
jgi:hypothetical protein